MTQETRPLYGELVIPFEAQDRSGVIEEASLMEDQTRLMIEEAAYFLAEKRGFSPGYELQDWLEAEKLILKG
ncbi:MAG: DUF2934 domain-containing protein [Burkholderiales bacterium]|nr:DUF2934 domain-containing protein [Burkholderiales bacterium]